VRPVGFVVVLVVLAFAGLLVGRALRDSGAPTATPTVTLAVSAPAPTPPRPAPKPAFERWGPLKATQAGRLARPAVRAAAVLSGGRVVVLGGSASDAVQVGPPAGPLRATATLPGTRAGAAAFLSGGSVHLIGGEDGAAPPTDEILRVDAVAGTVEPAGSFVEPIAGAGYVQGADALFVVGGWTGTQYATAVLRYTLPDTASVVARLPVATRDMAVGVRGDTIYAAGGRTADGPTDAVYAVDLAAGTVEVLGRLPEPVWGATLAVVGGQLYVLGGRSDAGPVRTVVRIDPARGVVERAGAMPKPLAGAAAIRVGGATFLYGGTRPQDIVRLTPG
jgi:hypothetical protein